MHVNAALESLHVVDYVLSHYPTRLYELLLRQQLLYGALFAMPVTTTTTLRFTTSVYGIGATPVTASPTKYDHLWSKLGIGFTSHVLDIHDAMMKVSNSDLLLLTHIKQNASTTTTPATTKPKRLICSAHKTPKIKEEEEEEAPTSRSPKRKMSSSGNSPRPKRRSIGDRNVVGVLFEPDDPFCDI